MNTLVLNCENGASKESVANQLMSMLPDEGVMRFLTDFNNAGLDGAIASADGKPPSLSLAIKVDGVRESELHRGNAHEHHSRKSVEDAIRRLNVSEEVRQNALGIYGILANAEAKAHGTTPDDVHFHEVGNTFAIGYIIATCMLVELLSPKQIASTPITCGFGHINCAHGRLLVPAPATANILDGIPHISGNVEGELCTPTGAAIVTYFASSFDGKEQ